MKRSRLALAAVILISTFVGMGFQNCSGDLPTEVTKKNNSSLNVEPIMMATDFSGPAGGALSIPITLLNIDKSYVLNWALSPATADFSVTSGSVNIAAKQSQAAIGLTAPNPVTADKVFTLQLSEVTGKMKSISFRVKLQATVYPGQMGLARHHSCAALNGVGKCWGYNGYGQLGTNDNTDRSSPVVVSVVSGAVQSIVSTGDNYHGQDATCALIDGAVRCWGANTWGQLGDGSTQDRKTSSVVAGLESGVTQISGGNGHFCAIKSGALYCWGRNDYGQLGLGNNTNYTGANQVLGLGAGVTAVAAGYLFTCAIHNGAAKCWGDNGNGEQGVGNTTRSNRPGTAVVGADSGVTSLAVGNAHACAVVDGAAKCWGYNGYGQIGDGSNTNRSVATSVAGLGSGVTQITVGQYASCALVSGAVKCWGRNNQGQLGEGSKVDKSSPTQVVGLTSGIQQVAMGSDGIHACALSTTGSIKCWGYNGYGQLGDGTKIGKLVPTAVP